MQVDTPNPAVADDAATGETAGTNNTDSTTATAAGEGKGQGDADGKPTDKTDEAGKADDAKTGEDDKKDDEPQGAPEQYEAFTLPEGFALEGERLDMAHEFAKANGWTQEQAQDGVNTYLKFRAAEMEHERGLWGAQSEQEFGKDFSEITAGAQRALVFAEKERPGITERLDATNLGNHPDVLWAFNKLGLLAKGPTMRGMENETSSEGGEPRDAKQVLYPNEAK